MTARQCNQNALVSYVQEFSRRTSHYINNKSEESLTLLNRSVSLLCAAKNLQDFAPTSLEICKFYIDLHAVIDCLATVPDTDVLWASLNVVQHASRNQPARKAIINDFRFVPLLTKILRKVTSADKLQRLLTILQDLTYDISITWEEPYLVVLVETLVKLIYNDDEEQIALLALSVLVNLCYKNFTVICLLLRTVNTSSFSRKIHGYGVLASKMLIILLEDINVPELGDLHLFLKANFLAIEECLKTWNVAYLRHIVEFIRDSEAHKGFHYAVRTYADFGENIERLLDGLDGRLGMDDSTDDTRKNQQVCFSLIFRLLSYIFELKDAPSGDSDDNMSSSSACSEDCLKAAYDVVTNWIDSEFAGPEAIGLLEVMVRMDEKDNITKRIAKDTKIISQLITISENNDEPSEHITAILKLILTLLNRSKTEKLILSKITESYFDKIFAGLITVKPEMLPCATFSTDDIAKFVYCLLVLIEFTNIAKKAYFDKVSSLLQMQQIQFVLAKAILSESETVCDAVFRISQFESFPRRAVSKFIAQLSNLITPKSNTKDHFDQCPNLGAILKSNHVTISREAEDRLDALMKQINRAHENAELNNVATSQLIELYSHKINMLRNSEIEMTKKMEDASNEITNLSQQVCLQKSELERYHTMNFKLHITQERLQTECKDLTAQKSNLKSNITNMMKQLREQTETLKMNEKRLEVKTSEMIVLKKEYTEAKQELESSRKELDKLQSTSKEYASRIEKLKKTIDACETDMKDKRRALEDRDKELSKSNKIIEDLRESLSKSDNVVQLLETQLAEKNEAIRSYENELSETEEMRKTILSLMESKRPKRKT